MRLEEVNTLDQAAATAAFLRCCGSSRWAAAMAAARPFATADSMRAEADAIWGAMGRADWLEAFAAHPVIGAARPAGPGHADAAEWAQQEQASVAHAERETLERLDAANREYEARFGYIFIVCATGRSAAEMLALLECRLGHDAGSELVVAAEQQRQITRLRLQKLLAEERSS